MIQENNFLKKIANDAMRETALGISVLWLLTKLSPDNKAVHPVGDIIEKIKNSGLRGNLNATRFYKNLAGHTDTVRHKNKGLSLSLKSTLKLDEKYAEFLEPTPPEIDSHIVEQNKYERCKKYTKTIILQINSSYQFHNYDACAVLMRRLVESLLIDAFEAVGKQSEIKNNNDYSMLKGIIAKAKSGNSITLSRTSKTALDDVKRIGDKAAHNRTYLTSKRDIDELRGEYRPLIEDLVQISMPE